MNQIAIIFIGSGIGGVCRFLFGKFAFNIFGASFPFGTLGVNIIGSFIIGIAAAALIKHQNNHLLIQDFIMIGLIGGFTTFSSFSLDTLRLIEHGRVMVALSYIAISVIGSLAAVFIGMAISKPLM